MKNRIARAALSLTLAAAMTVGSVIPAYAGASTDPNASAEREATNAQISQSAATEGMVLLDNESGVLPMAKSGNVALFGAGVYATVKGGTGSGDVYLKDGANIDVEQGFEDAGLFAEALPPVFPPALGVAEPPLFASAAVLSGSPVAGSVGVSGVTEESPGVTSPESLLPFEPPLPFEADDAGAYFAASTFASASLFVPRTDETQTATTQRKAVMHVTTVFFIYITPVFLNTYFSPKSLKISMP